MNQIRKVVEALMKHGPKYTTISRETGVPITTVRYILREKLPKLGFTLHAAINYGKLGLQRYMVTIDTSLAPNYMTSLLKLFGETMYLSYYSYLLSRRKFFTIFSIPPKFESSFIAFLDDLIRLDLIRTYELKKLYYRRILSFREDCFDFDNGVWIQNWEAIPRVNEVPEIYEMAEQTESLTTIDLKILNELVKDSLIKLTNIAMKLNVTRQTIKRHYSKILKTIYQYTILWIPPHNPEIVCTPVLLQTHFDEAVRRTILNIPFAYLEMKSEDLNYYTILLLPSLGFYKVIRYISEKINQVGIDFLSMENAANFLIPHGLFNEKKNEWVNVFEIGLQKILREVELRKKLF
jgi:hypothetical protein